MPQLHQRHELLKDEIEEINRRFGTVDRTGNTLDDLWVRVNCHENDMADLRRQVERHSTPLPPTNQQAGTFPIPVYSGERSSLSRFLKQFHAWTLSSRSEDALSNSRPVILTGDKSQRAGNRVRYADRGAVTNRMERSNKSCRER